MKFKELYGPKEYLERQEERGRESLWESETELGLAEKMRELNLRDEAEVVETQVWAIFCVWFFFLALGDILELSEDCKRSVG